MKNNKIAIGILTIGIMMLVSGVSYAFFTYSKTSDKNSQLITGEVYMHYNDGLNTINLENAFPLKDEVARSRTDNIIDFTIDGKNTTTNKDIYYEIKLVYGNNIDGKTRLKDKDLKFDLIETINGVSETVLEGMSYDSINNTRIWVNTIPKNTAGEIEINYELRMWISDDTIISDTDSNADYTTDIYKNSYANIKVKVYGDFVEKKVQKRLVDEFVKNIENATNDRCNPVILDEEGFTHVVLDGWDCEDFNYVWYSGKLWRITAINPDKTMKMITEEVITTIAWGEKGTISESDTTSAYPDSYVRQWLNQEFLPTLNNYENIIVTNYSNKPYKWNASTVSGDFSELSNTTLLEDKVGLLNTKEYDYCYGEIWEDCWLNKDVDLVFINPYDYNEVNCTSYQPNYGGVPNYYYVDESYSIRPVINVLSNTHIIGGRGTSDDPFIIDEKQEQVIPNVTLINTRSSGEYIKIEGDSVSERTFRIVNIEKINNQVTTKLITSDYVKDTNDLDGDGDLTENLKKEIGNSVNWDEIDESDETYWKGYLNNTWLEELDSTFNTITKESSILEKGIYFIKPYAEFSNYKYTICDTIDKDVGIQRCFEEKADTDIVWKGYVGILRVGEMFTNYLGWWSGGGSCMSYLITPVEGSDDLLCITDGNSLEDYGHFAERLARPTINLKSNLVIKSGSGTEQDPFVVGLPN